MRVLSRPPLPLLLAAPLVAAITLGAGITWLASVAASTLRQRDEAARDGVLLRLGHELEAELRDAGPEDARATTSSFLARHADALIGAEILGPDGIFVSEGLVGHEASEQPALLGPSWRLVMGAGDRATGAGPGRGAHATLRLQASSSLGRSARLARLVIAGAAVAAVALVGFSLLGVAGLAQRHRFAIAEAERRRLEVLALAGAGLAHRIRNPLAGIKGTTQLLLDSTASQVHGRAQRILRATERIEALLGRLLAFARPPEANPEEVDLSALAGRVVSRAVGPVRLVSPEHVSAWADEEHVEAILEELLSNARAFDPEGLLEVELARDGDFVSVEVRDRGPGLAVDPVRAFDPYVTTRPEGTGLGLPIVRALAHASGGEVTLAPRQGCGCTARLVIPAERP